MKRILCIALALSLLLSGCSLESLLGDLPGWEDLLPATPFSNYQYIRPDMETHDGVLEACIALVETETDLDTVMNTILEYYEQYDLVNGAYTLAHIYYCRDPEDLYWSSEYAYCAGVVAQTEAGLEALYCALAQSPIRDQLEGEDYFGADYFDAYENGGVWDETLLDYSEQEALLIEEYYALSGEAAAADSAEDYALPLAELLVELVALRQEMAAYLGYADAIGMAYEWYHYRDYTPEQVETYLEEIAGTMSAFYHETWHSDAWNAAYVECTPAQTYSYTQSLARALGGDVEKAFDFMEKNGLYDLTISDTKVDISFETYIYHYYVPYIFTNPYGTLDDQLTFTHEFGHFVNDWLCDPSYVGTDVAEVHSQGMEYLSLFYADGGKRLERYKLADCLSTYVDQALYALFEHRLYQLTGDQLTAENVLALYKEVSLEFGYQEEDFRDWDFVWVPHFYAEPLYVISYVVSNDVAFQLYQLEAEQEGTGLALYRQLLDSQECYLLTFVEAYGLESPFAPGRVEAVLATLEAAIRGD